MDNLFFASVYSYANREIWSDTVIILFAAYWEIIVAAILLAYLWLPKFSTVDLRTRAIRIGWAALSAIVARFGIDSLIRLVYPRPRPFVMEDLNVLISQNPLESSFPSGHATFFMAMAVYLLLAGNRKLGLFMLGSAVAISIARVAAGVHWPSDVVAGWLVGGLVSLAMFKISNRKQAR